MARCRYSLRLRGHNKLAPFSKVVFKSNLTFANLLQVSYSKLSKGLGLGILVEEYLLAPLFFKFNLEGNPLLSCSIFPSVLLLATFLYFSILFLYFLKHLFVCFFTLQIILWPLSPNKSWPSPPNWADFLITFTWKKTSTIYY